METVAMKELLDDSLKLGNGLRELLMAPTPRGRLHTQVRVSRPNWSSGQCFKALRWMRRNGLRPSSDFSSTEDYLAHLHDRLTAYAKANPNRATFDVADDLSLSRWEARWRRVRGRQLASDNTDSATDDELSSVA